jgi:osmotically-inducible protein OsmY
VRSAVSDGNVNVVVENGVATLFGWVDSQYTETAAKQAALSFDNVDSVVDRIVISR